MIPSTGKLGLLAFALGTSVLAAGPYSLALNDPSNAYDAPVPGFLGPEGIGKARYSLGFDPDGVEIFINPRNHLNPLFFDWAREVVDYAPSESVAYYYETQYLNFGIPSFALGPVTGDSFDVVSLGDMTTEQIQADAKPGTITIKLAKPIQNLSGADFVVFENGMISLGNQEGVGAGGVFGELAYVEVSADGVQFHRFPCVSQTGAAVSSFGSLDPTQIHNLAGKHANKDDSWGTPFDLEDLAQSGLDEITHIRLVDIPGTGDFLDSREPPKSIYDPHKTIGSGGFDLEAIGAISTAMTYPEWPQRDVLDPGQRGEMDDPDGDGLPNLLEYAFVKLPWSPDAAAPILDFAGGHAGLTFIRDERLKDLVYEVQVSSTMASNDWTTIARSTAGAPFEGADGHTPVIFEVSAETIRSIGVIRKVTVRDVVPAAANARRFLRVKVTTTSASIPNE